MEKLENKKTLTPQERVNADWENWKKEFAQWEEIRAKIRAEINKHDKDSVEYKVLSELFEHKRYYKEQYFMNKAHEIYLAQNEINKTSQKEVEQTK